MGNLSRDFNQSNLYNYSREILEPVYQKPETLLTSSLPKDYEVIYI